MQPSDVLVAVDSSPASVDALTWALARYRDEGRTIVVVHVVDCADAALGTKPNVSTDVTSDARAVAAAHLAAVHGCAPGQPARSEILTGEVADALVTRSADAAVLVLGSLGRDGFHASLLGSLGHRVATRAHCPVVVVPPGAVWKPGAAIVLGAVDGLADRPAHAFAAHESELTGARVERVPPNARSDLDWTERLQTAAGTAALLVVGCHRHADGATGRLGSVAAAMLAHPRCAVALVPRIVADQPESLPVG